MKKYDEIIDFTKVVYKLELSFPDDIREIAIKDGEIKYPDKVCEILQRFKNLIFENGECNPHRTEDDFLIKFLRTRHWNVEIAYELLCQYSTFRKENIHWIENFNPIKSPMIDEDTMTLSPYRDQTGKRIMIFRFGIWDPSKISVDDFFKACIFVFEVGTLEPRTQILGGVGILDLENLSLIQFMHLTPSIANKIVQIIRSYPCNIHAVHVVNQGWLFNLAYSIFSPFLDQEMKEKLFTHGKNFESLHQHINRANLPKRYGGEQDDSDNRAWFEHLKDNMAVIEDAKLNGYTFDEE